MGLRENILRDPIAELELRELVAVTPATPVREAADRMRRSGIGCVIVLDAQDRPIGKFTERKLMKLLLEGDAGLDQPIERFMYHDADCVRRDQPIAALLRLMTAKKLRFVCVTDETGRAVGLTGQKGLMAYIAEHFPRQVKVQEMEPKLGLAQREGA